MPLESYIIFKNLSLFALFFQVMQPVMTPDDYIPFCDETINIYFVSFFPKALLLSVGSGVVGVTALIVVSVVALFVAWVLVQMAELVDRGHGLEFLLLGYTYL